ncbi:MAG: hypothetical protein F6K56_19815 [Moorea sp. SIO3G5]|nr:hypothetical protein [Moorena sp. SIO3G5]
MFVIARKFWLFLLVTCSVLVFAASPVQAQVADDLFWVQATRGESCFDTCRRAEAQLPIGLRPVPVGIWERAGEPFKVCAGGEGTRPGYQLNAVNATGCTVPQGTREYAAPSHFCLCSDDLPSIIR